MGGGGDLHGGGHLGERHAAVRRDGEPALRRQRAAGRRRAAHRAVLAQHRVYQGPTWRLRSARQGLAWGQGLTVVGNTRMFNVSLLDNGNVTNN